MFMNQKFINIGFMNILKHLIHEQFMNVKFMKYSFHEC